MLKITRLSDKPALSRNNSNKSAFSRNNNSRPAFGRASGRNDGDGEVDRFGIGRNDIEDAKKSGILSKSGKSKSEKTSKS